MLLTPIIANLPASPTELGSDGSRLPSCCFQWLRGEPDSGAVKKESDVSAVKELRGICWNAAGMLGVGTVRRV